MTELKTYSVSNCNCSGCQACVEMCPELFAWDEINEVVIMRKDCADQESLEKAMAYCPNDCIDIDDTGTTCKS